MASDAGQFVCFNFPLSGPFKKRAGVDLQVLGGLFRREPLAFHGFSMSGASPDTCSKLAKNALEVVCLRKNYQNRRIIVYVNKRAAEGYNETILKI